MFSKTVAAIAVASAALFSAPAIAQIESDSMGDLNAWGQRYLPSDEKEFPSNLWRSSNDDTLLTLLQSINPSDLTPSERRLLRRVILSPATRPRGARAEALLAERARLMLAVGEARAAAALFPQLEQETQGLDAETLAVDLDMASGQEASACGALSGAVDDGAYWLKLRAVCAVLQDNFSGAQLAIEVASAQGVNDPWMIEAIFAAAGDTPNPPNARFDSGLNIALSSKAALDTSRITLASDRPDLAAATAQHSRVPIDVRARNAEIASEAGLIDAEDRRDILMTRLEMPDYSASSQIEQALQDLNDPLVSDEQRTERLASVLQSASQSELARYRSTAQLFLADLGALPQSPVSAPYAIDYARAAMIAGDRALSLSWLGALDYEGVEQPHPFEIARLEAIDVMAGGDDSEASLRAIEKRLISTSNSAEREIQTADILTAWSGLGLPLSPLARDMVSQVSDRGERIPQGHLVGLKSATRSGAVGEAALMVLAITNGDAQRLAPADFAVLLETLIAIDAEEVARDLALETVEFWRETE